MPSYTKVHSPSTSSSQPPLKLSLGREATTGRKVAIKKIKVGLFKDGLDMSAIREVKYLRELKHQNVIEVWPPQVPFRDEIFANSCISS